jgi:hypothetical protein
MKYASSAIPDLEIPRSRVALLQHVLETYASETNKVISVWANFTHAELGYRPHASSSSVTDVMKHQLLSERRFFAEFTECRKSQPTKCCRKHFQWKILASGCWSWLRHAWHFWRSATRSGG